MFNKDKTAFTEDVLAETLTSLTAKIKKQITQQ